MSTLSPELKHVSTGRGEAKKKCVVKSVVTCDSVCSGDGTRNGAEESVSCHNAVLYLNTQYWILYVSVSWSCPCLPPSLLRLSKGEQVTYLVLHVQEVKR